MRPFLVLFFAGCTASSSGGTPRTDTLSAAQLRESMMQADRDFSSDFANRRIEAWVSWFDTAGMQVEPGGTTPRGHEQIRAHMMRTFGDTARILAWRPTTAEVSDDGTLGYTIGTYDFHVRGRDSAASASTGHYLTVWRRQADGSWKVLADIGTQHPKKQ
jgi:ketosteroid isomerase-like protein